MMNELIPKLNLLKELLTERNGECYSTCIEKALSGNESDAWAFLCSNDLWGGAGSIADQAAIENEGLRRRIELLLIEIGELQLKAGQVNVKTEMWISAFKKVARMK